jgi:hypothetical protein
LVAFSISVAAGGPAVEVPEFDTKYGCLKSIESAVEAHFDVVVSTEVTVNAQVCGVGQQDPGHRWS